MADPKDRLWHLHVPPWLDGNVRTYTDARVQKSHQQLDDLCGALGEHLTAECRVLIGEPAETIVALAARERADMLILPLRQPAGLLRGKKRGTGVP